ncbi:MAG: protein kinase [Pyrinomonadaceae bacterium]
MKICSVCDRCLDDCETVCVDPDHGDLHDGPHTVVEVHGYLITSRIAHSPKASIYHAEQIEYGQKCVISIADGESKQFLAEAKLASVMFHAGVAGLIESGQLTDGSGYAVFEGFGEVSLRDVLQDGTLSLLERIRIARQTAEAIASVHLAGLRHGSIRPESISIADLGTDNVAVKIHNIDLGSAFANGILCNRFAMESSLETLKYLAPEQFRGEPATARSDVYGLGILLYELLSGHPPFDASSASALADMHLNRKPPETKIDNFDLRMLLTHTLFESLQKQPGLRQSTADLFARQMRHIEQLATHVSTPPPVVAAAAAGARSLRCVSPEASIRNVRVVTRPGVPESPYTTSTDASATEHSASFQAVPATVPMESPPVHNATTNAPMPFVPLVTKRSRLKGMKQRLQTHISDAKESLSPKPMLIDWKLPLDTIQSTDTVSEELVDRTEAIAFHADAEVTHVRPRVDRIEVNLDEAEDRERRPFALTFLPTLLSRREDADPSGPALSDSVFSAYRSLGIDAGKLPIYAVTVVAFLIVGFGIFRIASALSEDNGGYIGEARPAPIQISAPVVKAEQIEPQVAVMNIPASQSEIASPVAVVQDEAVTVNKTVPIKAKQVDELKPMPVDPPKRSRPEPASTVTVPPRHPSKAETPLVPSTLVITRGVGKPRQTIVAETPVIRRAAPGTGATRPRIVNVPN